MYLQLLFCWTRVRRYLDITEKYDELVANPNITKTKINETIEISKLQYKFYKIDTANCSTTDGKNHEYLLWNSTGRAYSWMMRKSIHLGTDEYVTWALLTLSTWWLPDFWNPSDHDTSPDLCHRQLITITKLCHLSTTVRLRLATFVWEPWDCTANGSSS